MKIVIPTHRRSHLIGDYAFKHLKSYGIDLNDVYLFVNDSEDFKRYADITDHVVNANVETIVEMRNFIREYFNEGEYIVSLDDSFNGLSIKCPFTEKLELFTNFKGLVDDAFKNMKETGSHLWGINQLNNPFFMQCGKVTTTNVHICSKFHGFINDYDLMMSDHLIRMSEDVEMSVLNYAKYGSTVRYDDITYNQPKYFSLEGGVQSQENITGTVKQLQQSRKHLHNEANEILVELYPEQLSIKTKGTGLYFRKTRKAHLTHIL